MRRRYHQQPLRGSAVYVSLDCVFLSDAASVFPDHAHFFPTETSVLDSHSEEHVFVLLVIGGKSVLVEQHQFRVIRARFREFGKLRSDGGYQAGLSLHALVIGHPTRIADSESARMPQVVNIPRRRSPRLILRHQIKCRFVQRSVTARKIGRRSPSLRSPLLKI